MCQNRHILLLLFVMRVKAIILSVLFCLCFCGVLAGPAYPHKIPVCIGKDTVFIRLYGDEHNKRAESLEGYTLLQKGNVWYYAEPSAFGKLVPSAYRLSKRKDDKTITFLEGLSHHLVHERNNRNLMQESNIDVRTSEKSAVGFRRVLVVLMQYQDLPFIKSLDDFNNLFNEKDYREDGAQGSVADYYLDVSYGKLQLTCDVIGPFTTRFERSHYGANNEDGDDMNSIELFEEAMEYITSEVRLSDYDADADGYVDNIHIIFAGHGEEAGAPSDAIWSHESSFREGIEYQGMLVDRYSCAPELRGNAGNGISRIGPHCHEIGHALGAKDYYDTNYEEQGLYIGTGEWDIMASGSWNADGVIPADFNPYVKLVDFGWIEAPEMPEGEIVIPPSCNGEHYYRLSNNRNDYYLVENRSKEKWGAGLPGEGMLIFHVHPNISSGTNTINATHPQLCYPVCASSTYSLPSSLSASYGDINSTECPFPGSLGASVFSSTTTPMAFSWNNQQSYIDLRGIHISSGDIVLQNHTLQTGYSNGDILLDDQFEIVHDLEIGDKEALARWDWYIIPEGMVLKGQVKPHSGNGCIYLKTSKIAPNAKNCYVEFSSSLSSNRCPALLSFYYQGVSYEIGNKMLDVYYKCDNGEWSLLTIDEDDNPGWKNISISLPSASYYTIKLVGSASNGQAIYVDDILITQQKTTTIDSLIQSDLEVNRGDNCIYNFLGRKVNSLYKGIIIVKQKDGTYKKKVVR